MEENLNQNIVPPTEPVLATSTPPVNQPPFGSWWKLAGLVLGAVILAGGLFLAGYQYSQKQKTTIPYPTPTPKSEACIQVITSARNPQTGECKGFPTPCDVPPGWTTVDNCSTSDETASWKTYQGETDYTTDGSTRFVIKYPAEWEISGKRLYPFGKTQEQSVIILGTGGRGGPVAQETRTYPAGIARYYWSLDTSGEWAGGYASFDRGAYSYIIGANNIPSKRNKQYEDIFNQILSTFQFLD